MGKTIGIVSLKGGVGKTSVVASLGDAISCFGKKVLLVDGNMSSPTLGMHFKVLEPQITLNHILCREANIDDAVHKLENFDLIPSSFSTWINVSPLGLKDKIKGLKRKYDVILMDSSPLLNEETLAVMLASDTLLVVTTPDIPTLATTIKAVKAAKQRGVPIDGIIINKVHNRNFELSTEEVEKTAGVPVMAVIPYDINSLKALSEFTPSTSFKPNSESSHEYKRLAATLIGEKYHPIRWKEVFRINPTKQEINREIFYSRVFE
jgi:septum site-determining protein MinD